MIHTSLSFLTQQINENLKLRTDDPAERVFLTSVATENGIVIPPSSLGLSLINIEEERHFKDQKTTVLNQNGIAEQMNPEIKLNLFILISANFQDNDTSTPTTLDYEEGLKQLSYVISFFQSKNVFTPNNSPDMVSKDPDLRKLVVELYSYSFEQLYNFWSVVGTKYLPSVLYRVRLIRFQEKSIKSTALPIEKIGINSHGANHG